MRELVARLLHRWALRHWERAGRDAADADLPRLRRIRARARSLRPRLDHAQRQAELRLWQPLDAGIARPPHCDWAWRPEGWRQLLSPPGLVAPASGSRLGAELELFHDARHPALILRQIRGGAEAPFALALETLDFDGSFLSLALTLPAEAAQGLRRRHVLRLALRLEGEGAPAIFARLNLRHGPNTEQITRALPSPGAGESTVEIDFDLDATRINEARLERLWLDLILSRPALARLTLRDLTLTRRPRADF